MSDFSVYKNLKLAELTSNAQFSTTGSGPSQTNTGAANAVSQTCSREQKAKIANLAATTSDTTEGEAFPWPYAATLKTANLTIAGGNAVANTTDYSTVNLEKRTGNGAAVIMATANLANVAVTQYIPIAFARVANAANYQIAAGDVITANVVLTGNGTANNLPVMLDIVAEDI
jgi:hypothetical protein